MAASTENDILARHEELKADLVNKIDAQAWWEGAFDRPHLPAALNGLRDTIQKNRVDLETAKGEDIKGLQSQISARKELLMLIEAGKSTSKVVESRNRLEEFEKQNALFINPKEKKAK